MQAYSIILCVILFTDSRANLRHCADSDDPLESKVGGVISRFPCRRKCPMSNQYSRIAAAVGLSRVLFPRVQCIGHEIIGPALQ